MTDDDDQCEVCGTRRLSEGVTCGARECVAEAWRRVSGLSIESGN